MARTFLLRAALALASCASAPLSAAQPEMEATKVDEVLPHRQEYLARTLRKSDVKRLTQRSQEAASPVQEKCAHIVMIVPPTGIDPTMEKASVPLDDRFAARTIPAMPVCEEDIRK